jgi:hypothetical protein
VEVHYTCAVYARATAYDFGCIAGWDLLCRAYTGNPGYIAGLMDQWMEAEVVAGTKSGLTSW